jgi:hypothetical protein
MLSIRHYQCPSAPVVVRMSASMRMVMMQLVFDLILHFAGFIFHLLSQALFVVAVIRAGCTLKLQGKFFYI